MQSFLTQTLGQMPGMRPWLVSHIDKKFPEYLACPDCGEDAVVHRLDQNVRDNDAELAPGGMNRCRSVHFPLMLSL